MAMTDDGATEASAPPMRPTITLPPWSSVETLFSGGGGLSPGPMTLVSSFFSDNYPGSDCRSFSQLLAGAMASPSPKFPSFLPDSSSKQGGSGEGGDRDLGFRQNRPVSLVVAHSPMFMIPPGLSPSGLLNSPGFFSPLQSPFGMTHQQALAQVTAQAALSQSYMHIQDESQPSSVTASAESLTHHQPSASNTTVAQQIYPVMSEPENSRIESSEASQSERKSLPPSGTIDKPGNDGYNWRKYGQKQVKASEYPRSYYRCTHLNCPVKKKVERNLDGQIIEIIYKGQHNHELPQSNKRSKDSVDMNPIMDSQAGPELGLHGETEMNRSNETSHPRLEGDQSSTQLTPIQLPGSSDFSEIGDIEARPYESNDDEPNPKRRNTELGKSEPTSSHKTVTEPRIVVQTRSEVDLLDDGFKWRKYGQKVVKGNLHPRSYYKCTTVGCNVRKHVERASTDPKAVVTTYEGKHNHDTPAARKSSHSRASNTTLQQLKAQKVVAKKPPALLEVEGIDFGNKVQRPNLLQLKEEQIRA